MVLVLLLPAPVVVEAVVGELLGVQQLVAILGELGEPMVVVVEMAVGIIVKAIPLI
jgi:hypothetical protein